MVLNMFFGPLTIPYHAWMMSHVKLKKFFALENWSQSNFFVREHQVLEVSFDAIFGQTFFQKSLHLNPKGKVALRSCLGPIFKRKKILGQN